MVTAFGERTCLFRVPVSVLDTLINRGCAIACHAVRPMAEVGEKSVGNRPVELKAVSGSHDELLRDDLDDGERNFAIALLLAVERRVLRVRAVPSL